MLFEYGEHDSDGADVKNMIKCSITAGGESAVQQFNVQHLKIIGHELLPVSEVKHSRIQMKRLLAVRVCSLLDPEQFDKKLVARGCRSPPHLTCCSDSAETAQ